MSWASFTFKQNFKERTDVRHSKLRIVAVRVWKRLHRLSAFVVVVVVVVVVVFIRRVVVAERSVIIYDDRRYLTAAGNISSNPHLLT